jgi:hypothetical protein
MAGTCGSNGLLRLEETGAAGAATMGGLTLDTTGFALCQKAPTIRHRRSQGAQRGVAEAGGK